MRLGEVTIDALGGGVVLHRSSRPLGKALRKSRNSHQERRQHATPRFSWKNNIIAIAALLIAAVNAGYNLFHYVAYISDETVRVFKPKDVTIYICERDYVDFVVERTFINASPPEFGRIVIGSYVQVRDSSGRLTEYEDVYYVTRTDNWRDDSPVDECEPHGDSMVRLPGMEIIRVSTATPFYVPGRSSSTKEILYKSVSSTCTGDYVECIQEDRLFSKSDLQDIIRDSGYIDIKLGVRYQESEHYNSCRIDLNEERANQILRNHYITVSCDEYK